MWLTFWQGGRQWECVCVCGWVGGDGEGLGGFASPESLDLIVAQSVAPREETRMSSF